MGWQRNQNGRLYGSGKNSACMDPDFVRSHQIVPKPVILGIVTSIALNPRVSKNDDGYFYGCP
jgi:hypothetical protein